jgi:hypothetical protein
MALRQYFPGVKTGLMALIKIPFSEKRLVRLITQCYLIKFQA